MAAELEVADVFRRHGEAYRLAHAGHIGRVERRVMSAIELCRTAALGGHIEQCEDCGIVRIAYNSCRNRHCPKCQGAAREDWLAARAAELLPVPYFHVVFTLQAPGAEIGVLAVLHTWGQTLHHHPHIHCVVPGGGPSLDGARWVDCRPGFFLPVRVLSKLFRRLFLQNLQTAFEAGRLSFFGALAELGAPAAFADRLRKLRRVDWVVYAKRPFGGPKQVLAYLGRYTHRVAISNSRLVSMENGEVTFRWKDYRHHAKPRLMTLAADEFIRRFLLHALPDGFHRIRHYGFLANSHRAEKLELCRR